ncbi:helix-turn-helix transcriptional regulator [Gemella cuniculi]|uniref:helix-turn-helix transcriptional regulator n=1 Tax=Gemella cuniculi TaxID=150240 RepID=UPI0003F63BAD|nr:WYL domain-containing protein [Gemella cuniculi]
MEKVNVNKKLRDKKFRALEIYDRFRRGEKLVKGDLAKEYRVSQKTIQRDIDELRMYLYEKKNEIGEYKIDYDYDKKVYKYVSIDKNQNNLTQQDILAVSKILLESRAFNKKELSTLLKKLFNQLSRESKVIVSRLLQGEEYSYTELQHGKDLLDVIWDLSAAIKENCIIKYDYVRMDKKETKKEVKPVAIMFSEYYFYLIAYSLKSEEDIPLVFRIDRMSNIEYTDKTFYIPYRNKFDEGEFRKRIQFMYGGKLKKIIFEFSGSSLEAALDRLPTAKILESKDNVHIIEAECYGDGIKMWLGSQLDGVKIIEEREM